MTVPSFQLKEMFRQHFDQGKKNTGKKYHFKNSDVLKK